MSLQCIVYGAPTQCVFRIKYIITIILYGWWLHIIRNHCIIYGGTMQLYASEMRDGAEYSAPIL